MGELKDYIIKEKNNNLINAKMFKCVEKQNNFKDIMIKASNGITKHNIIDVFYNSGLMGVYNLGMEHMYNYLKGEQ